MPAKGKSASLGAKKVSALAALIEAKLLRDGELLRYINYKGTLLGIGRARPGGIEVHGKAELLGPSAFERHVGGTAHRPNTYTFATNELSLTALQAELSGGGGGAPPPKLRRIVPAWGLAREPQDESVPLPLIEDPNDEYCRICWQGGELLCCETCPAVFHADCLRLDSVPAGDWHCPLCTCGVCGHPHFGHRVDLDNGPSDNARAVVWVEGDSGTKVAWTGLEAFGPVRPVVGVHANTFDKLWPEEGAKIAAYQARMKKEQRATQLLTAAAAGKNATGPQRPGKRKMDSRDDGETLVDGLHISLKRLQIMANRCQTAERLGKSLEAWAGKEELDHPGADPLETLIKVLCPDLSYRDRAAALTVLTGMVWNMRTIDSSDGDASDADLHRTKRKRSEGFDLMPGSPVSPSRLRRPGSGMPQRFRDTMMLSDDESDSDPPYAGVGMGINSRGNRQAGRRKRPTGPRIYSLGSLSARLDKLDAQLATPPPSPKRAESNSDVDIGGSTPLETSRVSPDPAERPSSAVASLQPTGNAQAMPIHTASLQEDSTAAQPPQVAACGRPGSLPAVVAGLPALANAGTVGDLSAEKLGIAQRLAAALHDEGYKIRDPAATRLQHPDFHPGWVPPWAGHLPALGSAPPPNQSVVPCLPQVTAPDHNGRDSGSAGSASAHISNGVFPQDPNDRQKTYLAVLQLLNSTTLQLSALGGTPPALHPDFKRALSEAGLQVWDGAPSGLLEIPASAGPQFSSAQQNPMQSGAATVCLPPPDWRGLLLQGDAPLLQPVQGRGGAPLLANGHPLSRKAEPLTIRKVVSALLGPAGDQLQTGHPDHRPDAPTCSAPLPAQPSLSRSADLCSGREDASSEAAEDGQLAEARPLGHSAVGSDGPQSHAAPTNSASVEPHPRYQEMPDVAERPVSAHPEHQMTEAEQEGWEGPAQDQGTQDGRAEADVPCSPPPHPQDQKPTPHHGDLQGGGCDSAHPLADRAGQDMELADPPQAVARPLLGPEQQPTGAVAGLPSAEPEDVQRAPGLQLGEAAPNLVLPLIEPAPQMAVHSAFGNPAGLGLPASVPQVKLEVGHSSHHVPTDGAAPNLQPQAAALLPKQRWQSAPEGPAPTGEAAQEVVCPSCLCKFHLGCLSEEGQHEALKEGGAWYCSPACREVSANLAAVCLKGVMPCATPTNSLPLGWQLIRGAAVASPQVCRGHAPRYSSDAAAELRRVLHAARHVAAESLGPVFSCRSHEDLLPMLLAGGISPDRSLDFSTFHTALLWAGGSLACVAVVRALDAGLAEIPFIVTRPELRGNGLAAVLLGEVEAVLLSAGSQMVAMPSFILQQSGRRQAAPTTRTAAVAAEPVVTMPWPFKVGYDVMTLAQSLRTTGLPSLHFPGHARLSKELSRETLTKAKPKKSSTVGPACPLQALSKAHLLVPTHDVRAEGAAAAAAGKKRQRPAIATQAHEDGADPDDGNPNDVKPAKRKRMAVVGPSPVGEAPASTLPGSFPGKMEATQPRNALKAVQVGGPAGGEGDGAAPMAMPLDGDVSADSAEEMPWSRFGMTHDEWQQGTVVPFELEL